MEMNQGQNQNMYCGDFFDRCLPKTYKYFKKMKLEMKYKQKDFDCFDNYIQVQIPVFAFLMKEYYLKNRPRELQLSEIADANQLLHFDHLILEYILKQDGSVYSEIKELYIYLVEKKMMQLLGK